MAMLSVGGNAYTSSAGPADELLFGSVDGLVILRRSGQEWRTEHRALQGLHVSSLALEHRSGTLFAGTHNGGVHASQDGGRTWQRRSDGVEQEEVYSLSVVDGCVYAGTEPAHLYVSDDAGHTWTDLPGVRNVAGTDQWTFPAPPHVAHVKHISIDPRNAANIYACVEQGGLLRSTNGGETFEVVFDAPATDAHRLTIPAGRPDRLYFTRGDWSIGYEGIYRSLDGGASWDRLWIARSASATLTPP